MTHAEGPRGVMNDAVASCPLSGVARGTRIQVSLGGCEERCTQQRRPARDPTGVSHDSAAGPRDKKYCDRQFNIKT